MLMLDKDKPMKPIAVAGAVAASFAMAGVLAGCATQATDDLPRTHLTQAGEVAASHGRCGACHQGGTRGDGTYVALDYWSMESLPAGEFSVEKSLPEQVVPESLYLDPMPEPTSEVSAQ